MVVHHMPLQPLSLTCKPSLSCQTDMLPELRTLFCDYNGFSTTDIQQLIRALKHHKNLVIPVHCSPHSP